MWRAAPTRGGQISQCLEDAVQAGRWVRKPCGPATATYTDPPNAGGRRAPQVKLMEETLHVAGASLELQTLARSLLGEVHLSATQGQLGTQQERPQAAMLQRYEGHRQTSDAALRQAIDELGTTGQVSDVTLRAVSIPGQALPRAALDALVTLQQDPVRAEELSSRSSPLASPSHRLDVGMS